MPFKNRNWGEFGENFSNNFNGMGVFITVTSGFLTAVSGFLVATEIVSNNGLYFSAINLLICTLSLIWIICKSWPNSYLSLNDFQGHLVPIADINKIKPVPFTIGLIGRSKTGKTTFLHKISHIRNRLTRTSQIYTNIIDLPTHLNPNGKLIIIDGDGKQFNQQFNIMSLVDILIIFFDHNDSSDNVKLNRGRLKNHKEFIEQVISNLKNSQNLKHIHLVINKFDLWGGTEENQYIIDWGTKIQSTLEESCEDIKVTTSHTHSNNIQDSIAEILENISAVKGEFYEKK